MSILHFNINVSDEEATTSCKKNLTGNNLCIKARTDDKKYPENNEELMNDVSESIDKQAPEPEPGKVNVKVNELQNAS